MFVVFSEVHCLPLCRVFDILVNNLPLSEAGQQPPPAKPPPGWREGMHARQFTASEAWGALPWRHCTASKLRLLPCAAITGLAKSVCCGEI